MTAKPLLALVALATASTTIGVTSTSVGAEPPFVFHFKGRAAQAILTDCALDAPLETECKAVDVFAAEERYQSRGDKFSAPFVSVVVYRVVIDDSEPDGFTATPVGCGDTEDADVSVARNLGVASVSAYIELFSCETLAELGESVTLDAEWTATGKRQTSTFHDRFSDDSFSVNFRAVDAFRPAAASGTVDEVEMHDTPLFPPSIFSTNQGSVERFVE